MIVSIKQIGGHDGRGESRFAPAAQCGVEDVGAGAVRTGPRHRACLERRRPAEYRRPAAQATLQRGTRRELAKEAAAVSDELQRDQAVEGCRQAQPHLQCDAGAGMGDGPDQALVAGRRVWRKT